MRNELYIITKNHKIEIYDASSLALIKELSDKRIEYRTVYNIQFHSKYFILLDGAFSYLGNYRTSQFKRLNEKEKTINLTEDEKFSITFPDFQYNDLYGNRMVLTNLLNPNEKFKISLDNNFDLKKYFTNFPYNFKQYITKKTKFFNAIKLTEDYESIQVSKSGKLLFVFQFPTLDYDYSFHKIIKIYSIENGYIQTIFENN